MAIIDSYLHYTDGTNRPVRRRKRIIEGTRDFVPTGTMGGLSGPFKAGGMQDTVDRVSLWGEAAELDRIHKRPKGERLIDRFDFGTPFYTRTTSIAGPVLLPIEDRVGTPSYTFADPYIYPHVDAAQMGLQFYTQAANQLAAQGDVGVPDYAVLNAAGAHGIAETLPSVPPVSVAQTLGELREGLPSLIGRELWKHKKFSSLGSEYLNYVFAVVPLISDMANYANSSKSTKEFNDRLARNNGRAIRRGLTLGDTQSVVETSFSNGFPYPSPNGGRNWATGAKGLTTTTSNKLWFSARYRVQMPPVSDSFFSKLKEGMDAYGVTPNAITTWQLTPWSWLLDWVVNFDDLFTNISFIGRKGVSLQYGYVMATTTVNRKWWYHGTYKPNAQGSSVPLSLEFPCQTVTKQRAKATPLGFGVTYDGLTNKQKSILAALGISRLVF